VLKTLRWLLLASFCFGSASVQAAIVLDGETNTIACGGGLGFGSPETSCPDHGGHFHSDVYFTNLAEVGGYSASGDFANEEIRGMSEFNITGLSPVSSATLSFSVYRQGSMFTDTNDTPFTGTIFLDAYVGNNSIFGNNWDIFTGANMWSDYQEASIGDIGNLSVVGGASPNPNSGDVFSFDVTELFNDAINNDLISLGVRLRQERSGEYGTNKAWTFGNFRLTAYVPEPGTVSLMALALVFFPLLRYFHVLRAKG
jgi:hypothetical protein